MRARDANRYLEQRFKYKAENLRAQQDHETIGPPHVNWNEFQLAATESTTSSSSSSSSTPLYVSSEYRAILGCYLYFLQNKKAAFGVESPVILISDDTQLQDYCRSIFGAVYCLNALSFSKSLAK